MSSDGVSLPGTPPGHEGGQEEGRGLGLLRSRGFVASLVFVVALAAGAVWIVVDRRGGDDDPRSGPSASVAVASSGEAVSAAGGDGGASVCGMDAGPQAVPSGPLEFQPLQVTDVVSVPVVDRAGPGVTGEGEITRCFAHSPTGAVVAAVNFMRWFSSQERLDEVTETLVEPSGDRDRLAEQIELGWDGATTTPQAIRGYRAEVRSGDEVLVTLLTSMTVDDERLVSWQLVMVWSQGDWRVRAPSNDSWGEQAEESTAGFSTWTVR